MSINSVNMGMNQYCGPAVLSILTGKNTDECASMLSSINGKYKIEGVTLGHLLIAADRMGFDCESINPMGSLYSSIAKLSGKVGVYIVTLPHHFVVVEVTPNGVLFCDNHTKQPMPAAASARMMQKVMSIQKVTKRREPIQLSTRLKQRKFRSASGVELEVVQEIVYDIEKFNRTVVIARIHFNTEDELREFAKELMNE